MRAVFDSVGIHDVLAKSKGSSNLTVKATIAPLECVIYCCGLRIPIVGYLTDKEEEYND